jgi:hypothetical protein
MLGLSGKEAERDDRFAQLLLDTEKANEPTQIPVRRTVPSSLVQRYRNLPLISKIVSILATLWMAFTGLRFLHRGIGHRGHHHGWKGMGYAYEEVCLALHACRGKLIRGQPVAIDVIFTPTVRVSEDTIDSQTSLPLYLQPFQGLEILWDQGVTGSLSVQADDNIAREQPYVVFQTADGIESPPVQAFATSDRLSVRFKSQEEAHKVNAILRVSSSAEVIPPIRIQGAETTLELSEGTEQMQFSRLEVDSLLSEFDFENLQVGSLRVSSGTGDIKGSFNVSHELDLRTST